MRIRLFDVIDAILLTGIVILLLLIARLLLLDGAEDVPMVTAVVLPSPTQTGTALPPSAVTPTRTRTPTPRPVTPLPSPTRTPSPTPLRTATSLVPQITLVPSVTPNATTVIGNTPVPPPAPAVELPPGSVTIALLGSDRRPNRADYRTDTIVLVNVNPELPSVTVLSIPRDLLVYIPGYQFQRINVADERGEFSGFPGGGAGLLKQTIEYNLGVHVDYYARVDFAGFIKIVDTLGGIDVAANCPIEDVFPDDPISEDPTITGTLSIKKPGIVHLDGKHALWYSRSRETTSDWDRSLRQQRVLRAMWTQANQRGLIARLPELWGELSSTVKTDLKLNDIIWLAAIGARLDATRIKGRVLDGTVLYHWTKPDTGAWVVLPIPGKLGPALQEIFSPPPNVAAQALPRIEIWNGAPDPDWGLLAADQLHWEGYLVTNTAPADRSDYAHTKIVDLTTTTKGSRRAALASIFRVGAANIVAQPDPNSIAQYRVIVGADYQPCYRPKLPGSGMPTPSPEPSATRGP